MKPLSSKVDHFLLDYLDSQVKQVNKLRKIIQKALPDIEETIKYGAPFFYPICYLNLKPDYIILGLVYGVMLTDPDKKLVGHQKAIRHFLVKYDDKIEIEYLTMLLQESLELLERGVKPI